MTATELPSIDMSFELIRSKFHDPEFLNCRGLGGEVPLYIYPYAAKQEDQVRALTQQLVDDSVRERQTKIDAPNIVLLDLWNVFIGICEKRGILEKMSALEEKRGSDHFLQRMQSRVGPEKYLEFIHDSFIERYGEPQRGRDVLIITGVGKIYPFMRAHIILESIQPVFSDIPVVLFYPGIYDGQQLKLFGTIADGNYYRAFNQL